MATDAFNEGVGHGGIAVNMTGGAGQTGVIIDPWNPNRETMKILQPDQFGTSIKKAGRIKNLSATGTAQLPTIISGNVVEANPLIEGQSFTDPLSGITYWISHAGQAYQSGQFWKQEIECEQMLNQNI
jgi:hypothetical protein